LKKRRVPPLLSDLVFTTLILCDRILFDECGACPHCGGELSGYDVKKKQFAIMIEKEQKRVVSVLVKRFICHQCGQVSLANQPFYPGTRIGSPVVDLCVTLGGTMPYSRVSSCLKEMGIVVDRWSVCNYARNTRPRIPAIDMFGFMIPLSIVSLSSLAVGLPEGRRIDASALLAACNTASWKETSGDFP
jgi:transcription elongation factor Elf1